MNTALVIGGGRTQPHSASFSVIRRTSVGWAGALGDKQDVVWGLLTDSSNYRDWNPAVLSIEGLMTPGSTIKLVSVASPKRPFSLEVTSMQEPVRMTWAGGMPLGLFLGVRPYELAPCDGGTTFSMTAESAGPLSGLMARA